MAITGRRGISCLRGIIGLGSLRMRARRWAMRWRRWRGRPRTPALDQVRSANQAASNQPVGGARTRPTTRINVIASLS